MQSGWPDSFDEIRRNRVDNMRRPVYILFCNDRYGRAYENVFRQWCRSNPGKVSYLIVRSAKNQYSMRWPGRIDRLAKDRSRYIMKNLSTMAGQRTVHIENVNRSTLLKGLAKVRSLTGFVAGFNQIFSKETINLFTALYNFHPSLLPYYRGPVPSYWCIRYKEAFSGATLHTVTPKIDEGAILGQEIVKIDTDDPEALDEQISLAGSQMLDALLRSAETDAPLRLKRVRAEDVYASLVDYRSFPTGDD
jgi:folate-dependent phosphoribosylglycinamide formyltransferase PurN